jgi:hypothetical protein
MSFQPVSHRHIKMDKTQKHIHPEPRGSVARTLRPCPGNASTPLYMPGIAPPSHGQGQASQICLIRWVESQPAGLCHVRLTAPKVPFSWGQREVEVRDTLRLLAKGLCPSAQLACCHRHTARPRENKACSHRCGEAGIHEVFGGPRFVVAAEPSYGAGQVKAGYIRRPFSSRDPLCQAP